MLWFPILPVCFLCFYFICCCFFLILICFCLLACLFSKERTHKGCGFMWVGRWGRSGRSGRREKHNQNIAQNIDF